MNELRFCLAFKRTCAVAVSLAQLAPPFHLSASRHLQQLIIKTATASVAAAAALTRTFKLIEIFFSSAGRVALAV